MISSLSALPIRLFPNNRLAAWFYFCMSAAGLATIIIQPYIIISNHKSNDIYASIGDKTTMTISPVYGLAEHEEIFIYTANLAIFAMLNRNPNGLDNDLLFKHLFLPECQQQILNQLNHNHKLFVLKNIHQKSEAGKFHILKIGDEQGQVLIRGLGQLILSGIDNGKPFSHGYNFAADFTLVKNNNLKRKGLLPYVVAQVNLKTFPK